VSNGGIIVVSGLYRDADDTRFGELLDCIRRNSLNPSVAEVHVLLEEPIGVPEAVSLYPSLGLAKVRPVAFGRRLKYQDLFGYANANLAGRTVAMVNADIFFDQTITRLDDYALDGRLLCLSRWDVEADESARFFEHASSQDAWIFSAPIRPFDCNFPMGVPGCDNRLAFEAERAGLLVSNPSRSIRALHLHRSGVRHYDERDRQHGPTRAVSATTLGRPWAWFIVPCMGRLDQLSQSIESLIAQPRATYVLVDYACPQRAGAWVRATHPRAMVVTVERSCRFHGAEARNLGAGVADQDAVLCFLDADMVALAGLSSELLRCHDKESYLVPEDDGRVDVVACSKADFDRVGGFDEALIEFGGEIADLRAALARQGLAERKLPAGLIRKLPLRPPAGSDHGVAVSPAVRQSIHAAYQRVKSALFAETGIDRLSIPTMREVHHAIARRELQRRNEAPEAACAAVAFRESMGCTVERLQTGLSTHNNERHAIVSIPAALAGLCFTQVVAHCVSPVDVRFLTPGKAYVLVGTGWYGYRDAVAWIRDVGYREPMPRLATADNGYFEVWSLLGEPGDRFTAPTQVMLCANELMRE
jgi:glycosyl transferase family 2